jgi:hypothetical protein
MPYLHHVTRTILLSVLLLSACLQASAVTHPREETPDQSPRISRCYPNPASSHIQFDIRRPSGTPLRLCVYNFLGRKVADLTRVGSNVRLDLGTFTRGIYIYQLLDREGRVLESGKFQVEH